MNGRETGKADKKEIRSRKNQKLYRDRFGKGGKIMKKLEIVIRPESLENLELLLEEQKANGMMITNILGYGNQKGYRQMYRGAEIVAKMLPKVKVETVVEDDKVPKILICCEKPVNRKLRRWKNFRLRCRRCSADPDR